MAIVNNVSFSDGGGGSKGLTDVQTGQPTAVRRIDVDDGPQIDREDQEISDIKSIASGGNTGYRPISAAGPFQQSGPERIGGQPSGPIQQVGPTRIGVQPVGPTQRIGPAPIVVQPGVDDPSLEPIPIEPIWAEPDEPDFQDKIKDIFNDKSKDVGDKIKDIFKETISETRENIHDFADSISDKFDDFKDRLGIDKDEPAKEASKEVEGGSIFQVAGKAIQGAARSAADAFKGNDGISGAAVAGAAAGAAAGSTAVDHDGIAEAVAAGASAQQIQDMINSGDVATARAVQHGVGSVQNAVERDIERNDVGSGPELDDVGGSLLEAVGAPDIAPDPEPVSTDAPAEPDHADLDAGHGGADEAHFEEADFDFGM